MILMQTYDIGNRLEWLKTSINLHLMMKSSKMIWLIIWKVTFKIQEELIFSNL